jgi:hypothetical protein
METTELKQMGKGIALRAGLLAAGGLLVTGWGIAMGAKVANAAIHLLLVAGVGLVGAGYVTYKVHHYRHTHGGGATPAAV